MITSIQHESLIKEMQELFGSELNGNEKIFLDKFANMMIPSYIEVITAFAVLRKIAFEEEGLPKELKKRIIRFTGSIKTFSKKNTNLYHFGSPGVFSNVFTSHIYLLFVYTDIINKFTIKDPKLKLALMEINYLLISYEESWRKELTEF